MSNNNEKENGKNKHRKKNKGKNKKREHNLPINDDKGKSGRKTPSNYDDIIDFHIINIVERISPYFYSIGLSPNVFTTLSFIFTCASCYFLYNKVFIIASICWFINYFFDSVDGNFARRYNMQTVFGDWYDHVTDIVGQIMLFFCILYTSNDIVVALLIIIILIISVTVASFHAKNEYIFQKSFGSQYSNSLNFIENLPTIDINTTRYYGLGSNVLFTCIIILFLPYIERFIAMTFFVK